MKKDTKGQFSPKIEESKEPFSFQIKPEDVVRQVMFPHFKVVMLKDGVWYENYHGSVTYAKRYTLVPGFGASETTLYQWFDELLKTYDAYKDCREEKIDQKNVSGLTKGDIIDYLVLVTEANLVKPSIVFADQEEASKAAIEVLQYINSRQDKLNEVASGVVKEETEEDKKAFLDEASAAVALDNLNEDDVKDMAKVFAPKDNAKK